MYVDVVFYDVTTFAFEIVKQNSLRNFGFFKNAKLKEGQIVMRLLIDRERRAIPLKEPKKIEKIEKTY